MYKISDPKEIAKKITKNFKEKGLAGTGKVISKYLYDNYLASKLIKHRKTYKGYDNYFRFQNETINQNKNTLIREIDGWTYKPLISVIMPTYNTDEKWLRLAIESVMKQIYPNWELCICDDNSPNERVREVLKEYAEKDKRIKITFSKESLRIAGATNKAIELATGEFVGMLDHDDELTVDALYEVAKAIIEYYPDFIYSDEDKIDMEGKYCEPFFKPDWSPDYFLSTNYVTHFRVFRKSIGDSIGWERPGFEGSQDYDTVLRFTEKTDKVYHIDKVLYHWRKVPGSTADSYGEKSYAFESGKKALEEAVVRRGICAEAIMTKYTGHYRVKRKILRNPKVSIIIPIRDKVELLKTCINSIEGKSTYKNYEIIIVDNGSTERATLDYLHGIKHKVLKLDVPFNFSYLNNRAVEEATGDIVLLLNNDIEVISNDWLEAMIEHTQRPEVGVVGAKLYYSNDTIQHAGVIMGLGGVAEHSHKNFPKNSPGYFGNLIDVRNYSAVTGACMMMRKEVYQEVGGLNEKDLAVAFNDVDICLRIQELELSCVFTPYAELYHHESVTRGRELNQKEHYYMMYKWLDVIKRDPYYNVNLTLTATDFSLK